MSNRVGSRPTLHPLGHMPLFVWDEVWFDQQSEEQVPPHGWYKVVGLYKNERVQVVNHDSQEVWYPRSTVAFIRGDY